MPRLARFVTHVWLLVLGMYLVVTSNPPAWTFALTWTLLTLSAVDGLREISTSRHWRRYLRMPWRDFYLEVHHGRLPSEVRTTAESLFYTAACATAVVGMFI